MIDWDAILLDAIERAELNRAEYHQRQAELYRQYFVNMAVGLGGAILGGAVTLWVLWSIGAFAAFR